MKKVYLKELSIEEIIKRLNNGDVIKDSDGIKFKMVNGFLIKSNFDESSTINAGLRVDFDKTFYFEDPEPITESGIYRLKNGKKVFIFYVKPHILFGAIDGTDYVSRWNPNGGAYMNDVLDKDHEIVGKWEEK